MRNIRFQLTPLFTVSIVIFQYVIDTHWMALSRKRRIHWPIGYLCFGFLTFTLIYGDLNINDGESRNITF